MRSNREDEPDRWDLHDHEPPDPEDALSFDEVEAAGLDGTLRTISNSIYTKVPICMEDDCDRVAEWRSDDGYHFCNWHGYDIYVAECELENLCPHTASMWVIHGRPHGPLGGERLNG